MKAIMLAAGIGRRLGGGPSALPKALLRFGGRSLLERHLGILADCAIPSLVVGVGYQAELLAQELARLSPPGFVRTVLNPRYEEGSIVTLWSLREELRTGEPILLMDADVLYDARLMRRLVESTAPHSFLMDRDVDPGEEPVKLAMRGGKLVDFHKRLTREYDYYGEWVGFVRLGPDMAAQLADILERFVGAGRRNDMYEDALRELVFSHEPGTFAVEDITGLPWIEIDFAEDVARAEQEILPRLSDSRPAVARAAR